MGANIWEPHQCPVERPLTQEDWIVCRAEGATVAPQGITAERPGLASDGEGGHLGNEGAARPARNWWKATWWCNTSAVETRKVRHVGRHSQQHTTLIQYYVHETSQTTGAASTGGSRKENKQIFVTDPVILVCSSRSRNMLCPPPLSSQHHQKPTWISSIWLSTLWRDHRSVIHQTDLLFFRVTAQQTIVAMPIYHTRRLSWFTTAILIQFTLCFTCAFAIY